MNEDLQSKLVEILTGIQHAVGAASDFTLSQLPDVVASYLVYGRVVATAALVAPTLVLVGLVFLFRWVRRTDPDMDGAAIPVCMFGGVAGFIAVFGLILSFSDVMLVWFAPKVWLLRELVHLVK